MCSNTASAARCEHEGRRLATAKASGSTAGSHRARGKGAVVSTFSRAVAAGTQEQAAHGAGAACDKVQQFNFPHDRPEHPNLPRGCFAYVVQVERSMITGTWCLVLLLYDIFIDINSTIVYLVSIRSAFSQAQPRVRSTGTYVALPSELHRVSYFVTRTMILLMEVHTYLVPGIPQQQQ